MAKKCILMQSGINVQMDNSTRMIECIYFYMVLYRLGPECMDFHGIISLGARMYVFLPGTLSPGARMYAFLRYVLLHHDRIYSFLHDNV